MYTPTTIPTPTPQCKPALHRFVLPITCEEVLRDFVLHAFNARIPDTPCCANHTTPWRMFADAFFARAPLIVVVGSRAFAGKSFLLSLLGLTEALLLRADVNVLGGSGEQSERVLQHMTTFWDSQNAPRHMLLGDVAREMRISNGAKIRALMASSRSVRGPHPQRLRIDEVDEVDLAVLDAALGQPMSARGIPLQTVLSSTHHYSDRTMTEVLRRAADRGWPVYRWCYKETREPLGWLTQEQIDLTRSTISTAMWEAEYELQEPSPESRAIMPASVQNMFRRDLGVYAGAPRQYIETEAPDSLGQYYTGQDWAKTRDWCITWTMRTDCIPARFVAFERVGREPYPAMVARFEHQVLRFNSIAMHDGTGLGSVVNDILSPTVQGRARAVIFTGRLKADVLSNYIAAIERGDIVSPFIMHAEAEHRLASREIFQGGDEHLPDTMCAGALAWHCAALNNRWESIPVA